MQIPAYFTLFRHNQVYLGIIQAYAGTFKTLYNSVIFRGLAYAEPETYSELWYIQKPGVFRNLKYSGRCQTSNDEAFCINS